MSRAQKFILAETEKKARQVKSKVKSMLSIFFGIKRIIHKEFFLAGQIVNSTYFCDVLSKLREKVRRLLPDKWLHKNWLLHHDNAPFPTSYFIRKFLAKNNMTVVPPTLLFSVSPD
jgi:hypothetical protein